MGKLRRFWMKSIVAAAVIAVSLSSHFAFAACGGGGWSKKSKPAQSDNAPVTKTSDTAVVQANTNKTVVKSETSKVEPQVITAADPKGKQLDTAMFDAVSPKLGL